MSKIGFFHVIYFIFVNIILVVSYKRTNEPNYYHRYLHLLSNYLGKAKQVKRLPPSLSSSSSPSSALTIFQQRYEKDIFDGWGDIYPDKNGDVDKTFSYLMPILLLIAVVTLTAPIIALFFFIFLWRKPPKGFGCVLSDSGALDGLLLKAKPRVYKSLIDFLTFVEKTVANGHHIYGTNSDE